MRAKVPDACVDELVPAEKVTLCVTAPEPAHVHVTVPPAASGADVGSKKLSMTETAACNGGPPDVAVALKVSGDPLAPETAARSELLPAAGPSVHTGDAVPLAAVVEVALATEPPPLITVQSTAIPATPLPSRDTRTSTGLGSAAPTAAVWPLPL